MDDVFKHLAAKLDELPHGFPPTQGGVELRILEKIFSPEDAEMALHLLPVPETVEAVSLRVGRPVEPLRTVLDGMAERGQILVVRLGGKKLYMLAPFVIGIYEFQLNRMDAELATLCEEYVPTLLRTVGGHKPALARVVPVNAHIDAHATILRTDSLREMLAHARSFRVAPCICRREQALLGSPCSHTSETCLAFSNLENAYEDMPVLGPDDRPRRGVCRPRLGRARRARALHVQRAARSDVRLQLLLLLLRVPPRREGVRGAALARPQQLRLRNPPRRLFRLRRVRRALPDGCHRGARRRVRRDGCPLHRLRRLHGRLSDRCNRARTAAPPAADDAAQELGCMGGQAFMAPARAAANGGTDRRARGPRPAGTARLVAPRPDRAPSRRVLTAGAASGGDRHTRRDGQTPAARWSRLAAPNTPPAGQRGVPSHSEDATIRYLVLQLYEMLIPDRGRAATESV